MNDSRLQLAESCLDDARAHIADCEDDGFSVVPSIQEVRDRRVLEQIHDGINHLIRQIHALKGGGAA